MQLRFVPPIWDRLVPDVGPVAVGASWTLTQLKEGIARDLQALFNTRTAWKDSVIERYPELAKSVMNYGMPDFTHLSMSSSDDRETVCAAMQLAIERFEPRLRNITVALEVQSEPYRLLIAISATLNVRQAAEPIQFDAFLDPSSQKYSIKNGLVTAKVDPA